MFGKPKAKERTIGIEECVDCISEVFREDNFLLFVGRIEEYNNDTEDIYLGLRQGNPLPVGILSNLPVKIQVRMKNHKGMLMIIYGNIVEASEAEWRVHIREAKPYAETRRAFRQKTDACGQILWGRNQQYQTDCRLEDISLVGVAFYSKVKLEIGEHVWLNLPQLVEEGTPYKIECEVVLRKKTDNCWNDEWRYGCSYVRLREWEENQLCKDILALQARDIKGEK